MDRVIKQISALAETKGRSNLSVFEDFLDYTIGSVCINNQPDPSWGKRYTASDNEKFFAIMRTLFVVVAERLEKAEWYDPFGDVYMALVPKGGARGQFFTPPSVCDLMATIQCRDEPQGRYLGVWGTRAMVSDPTAGSGRNLLAAHALFLRNGWREPYLVAEDVDFLCCKMAALNMMLHGCFGEVVCHNTLTEPKEVRHGFIINEAMHPFPSGVPSIRKCDDPRQFLCCR